MDSRSTLPDRGSVHRRSQCRPKSDGPALFRSYSLSAGPSQRSGTGSASRSSRNGAGGTYLEEKFKVGRSGRC
jgi:hypothetical protein